MCARAIAFAQHRTCAATMGSFWDHAGVCPGECGRAYIGWKRYGPDSTDHDRDISGPLLWKTDRHISVRLVVGQIVAGIGAGRRDLEADGGCRLFVRDWFHHVAVYRDAIYWRCRFARSREDRHLNFVGG